jgi:hypothetical protein
MDLGGRQFGRWTALSLLTPVVKGKKRYVWVCRCDCGTEREVGQESLVHGRSKSCGCAQVKHGNARRVNGKVQVSKEYRTWVNVKTRCLNSASPQYRAYGGRGITMCERWQDSFEAFLADIGPAPGPEYSLDRISPDKGYEPNNCRWSTRYEQDRNRTDNRWLEYEGERITITDLAEKTGVDRRTIAARLELGATVEEAVHA